MLYTNTELTRHRSPVNGRTRTDSPKDSTPHPRAGDNNLGAAIFLSSNTRTVARGVRRLDGSPRGSFGGPFPRRQGLEDVLHGTPHEASRTALRPCLLGLRPRLGTVIQGRLSTNGDHALLPEPRGWNLKRLDPSSLGRSAPLAICNSACEPCMLVGRTTCNIFDSRQIRERLLAGENLETWNFCGYFGEMEGPGT
jgi:hypothetical protein